MNKGTSRFSMNRINSFCSFFGSSEQDAKLILTQSPWAISSLNVIKGYEDEDVVIESTEFYSKKRIGVLIRDWNTGEILALQLGLDRDGAKIRLEAKEAGRTLFSHDLSRLVQELVPTDPLKKTLRHNPIELFFVT